VTPVYSIKPPTTSILAIITAVIRITAKKARIKTLPMHFQNNVAANQNPIIAKSVTEYQSLKTQQIVVKTQALVLPFVE
jgi:hypothetical protein